MGRVPREDSNYKTPNNGGCWFCYSDEGDLLFDGELDTYVHVDCLEEVLSDEGHKKYQEAEIMRYLVE